MTMTTEDWNGLGLALGRALATYQDYEDDQTEAIVEDAARLEHNLRRELRLPAEATTDQLLEHLRNREKCHRAAHAALAAPGLASVLDSAQWGVLAVRLFDGTKAVSPAEIVDRVLGICAEVDHLRDVQRNLSTALTDARAFADEAKGNADAMTDHWESLAWFAEMRAHRAHDGWLSTADRERFDAACRYAESRNLGGWTDVKPQSPAWVADWAKGMRDEIPSTPDTSPAEADSHDAGQADSHDAGEAEPEPVPIAPHGDLVEGDRWPQAQ
jgi:hypothetical protein